jgi:hypothetical protein
MAVSEVRSKLVAELRKAETQFGELYRRALKMAVEAFESEASGSFSWTARPTS